MKNSLGKSGAITLIALSVIAKAIGVLYRIPLFSLIGAQGVGIYQLSFSFYALLVSLVSGGVSVVVSRETSVKNAENDIVNLEKTIDVALVSFGSFALTIALLLCVFSRYVSEFLGNSASFLPLISLAPSVFFSGIIAVCRGYFQGVNKSWVVGASFVSEQVLKLSGMIVVWLLKTESTTIAVSVVNAGVSVGETLTAVLLCGAYLKSKRNRFYVEKQKIKPLFSGAITISLGSLIFPLGTFLEGASVVNALSTFAPLSEATALYGIMSGVVAPVVSMPSVVSSSFCSWLLPRLCSTSPQNRRSTFSKYARFPLVFSALASLTLVIFSKEILAFLYSLHGDRLSVGVRILTVASPIPFLSCALSLVTTYLQSQNKSYLPPINLLVGVALKLFLTPFLISAFSIYGAQVCVVISYLTAFVLGCFQALFFGFGFKIQTLVSVLECLLAFIFFAVAIYTLVPSLLGCAIALPTAVSVAFVIFDKRIKNVSAVKIVEKTLK